MKGDEMIPFIVQLYDLETGANLFSRKQFHWPALPRAGEMVLLDTSCREYHDQDFFEVEQVWHYIQSETTPCVCVVEFSLEHGDFAKFENRPEWIYDMRKVETSTP